MRRQTLMFTFSAAALEKACKDQIKHHTARVAYYTAEREAAEIALREAGVEFREHDVTGGKQVVAVIDPERQQWLNTCAAGVSNHERSIADFSRWGRAFKLAKEKPHTVFELDVDDVEYFGL